MQAALSCTPGLAVPSRQQSARHSLKAALLSPTKFAGRRGLVAARALGGQPPERKTLKREEEPEEYWTSKSERKGENPFKDPIAIIGIVSILFPFIFLGIAIALGWVDISGGR